MKWIELSLNVDGELAEAVSEVLSRYAPGGVAAELTVSTGKSGQLTGMVRVRAYLPVDESLKNLKVNIERGLWHLGQIQPIPEPHYRELEASDWENAWREHYHPIPIGRSLLILPPWYEVEAGERKPLIIEPGMAFGTGTHPTTQLCLSLMEMFLRPGAVVIDLGCGSGILSIGAALLGAAQVLALDIDRAAVEITRSNAERNGLAIAVIPRQGSLEEIPGLVQESGVDQPSLLVANILAGVLVQMLHSGLAESVVPGGVLILSGILEEQLPDLLDLSRQKGLVTRLVRGDGDWRAVALERSSE